MRKSRSVVLLLISLLLLFQSFAWIPLTNAQPQNRKDLETFMHEISFDNVFANIKFFSSLRSRFTGYPGFYQAASYIKQKFQEYGLKPFQGNLTQKFNLTVPIDDGSYVEFSGTEGNRIRIPAYALFPNGVVTSNTPPGGLTGELVYVHKGSLSDFNGVQIQDKIVLMDWDSGRNWLNAAKLGAKALIYVSSNENLTNVETDDKVVISPIYFPRVYVNSTYKNELIELAKDHKPITVVSNLHWKNVEVENIFGVIPGSGGTNEWLVIGAHYDSFSVLPALAPGANDAIGISILLELARVLSKPDNQPMPSILFIALPGHYQALAGSREFVDKYFFKEDRVTPVSDFQPFVNVFIDLYSDTNLVAPFAMGDFWNKWMDQDGRYTALGDALLNTYPKIVMTELKSFKLGVLNFTGAASTGGVTGQVAAIAGISGQLGLAWQSSWQQVVPIRVTYDSEPFSMAGPVAFTFSNPFTYKPYLKTPSDTLDKVYMENVISQSCYVISSIYLISRVSSLRDLVGKPWSAISPQRRGTTGANLFYGVCDMVVQIVEYNATSPILYTPIPNALVVVWASSYMGSSTKEDPTCWIIGTADRNGILEVRGWTNDISGAWPEVEGWVINYTTGRILFAPDNTGLYSLGKGPIRIYNPIEGLGNPIKVTSFRVGGTITLFDLIDPTAFGSTYVTGKHLTEVQDPTLLTVQPVPTAQSSAVTITLNNFYTHANPITGGYFLDLRAGAASFFLNSYEPYEVVIRTGKAQSISVVLANQSEPLELFGLGKGLMVSNQQDVFLSAFDIGSQLYILNTARLEVANVSKLLNPITRDYQSLAKIYFDKYRTFLSNNTYSRAWSSIMETWLLQVEEYIQVRSLYSDMTNVAVFSFFLFVVFGYVSERLLVSFIDSTKRLIFVASMASSTLLVLVLLNPAISLSSNLFGVLLGLTSLILALPAIAILFSRLREYAVLLRARTLGVHYSEVNKTAAFLISLSVGVQNARKRWFRTALALTSITLVSFSLLSLTSFNVVFSPSSVGRSGMKVAYSGVFIKGLAYAPLDTRIVDFLKGLVSKEDSVIARAWYYPELVSQGRAAPVARNFIVSGPKGFGFVDGVVGLEVNELPQVKAASTGWFEEGDSLAILIPYSIANATGLKEGDIATFNGLNLIVRGIFNESMLNSYVDLSQERFSPVDTNAYYFDPYTTQHQDWSRVIIMPYRFVISLSGSALREIVVVTKDNKTINEIKDVLSMSRSISNLQVFVAYSSSITSTNKTFTGTVFQATKATYFEAFGFSTEIFLLIIGGLIILNHMIGNVSERKSEIKSLNSVGASPLHIEGLFLSESIVYAVIGAGVGYLLALLVLKIISTFSLIPNFQPNYSGTFMLLSLVIILLTTILSSLYPARLASTLAIPSLKRKWELDTKPSGANWMVPYPFFTNSMEEALAVIAYIHEYFTARTVEGAGNFLVQEVRCNFDGTNAELHAIVFLPPYDVGVSQEVSLYTKFDEVTRKYFFNALLIHKTGIYSSWVAAVPSFVDEIRKQLLNWRGLSDKEKHKYIDLGKKLMGGDSK